MTTAAIEVEDLQLGGRITLQAGQKMSVIEATEFSVVAYATLHDRTPQVRLAGPEFDHVTIDPPDGG